MLHERIARHQDLCHADELPHQKYSTVAGVVATAKVILCFVAVLPNRRPRGPGGGQFTPGKVADTQQDQNLRLSSGIAKLECVDPVWSGTSINTVGDLKAYISEEDHCEIAEAQMNVADTSAELWYQSGFFSLREGVTEVLRGGNSEMFKISPTAAHLAQSLQQSILASELSEPCVLYRGVQSLPQDYAGQLVDTIKEGDTIEGEGFWSTTTDPETAYFFASPTEQNVSVIFRIETSVGKFLPSSSDSIVDSKAFFPEQEVLLPHGGMYEVLEKKYLEPEEDDDEDCDPCVLISLKYLQTKEDGRFRKVAERSKTDTDANEGGVVRDVRNLMKEYNRCGLPVGTRTTDV